MTPEAMGDRWLKGLAMRIPFVGGLKRAKGGNSSLPRIDNDSKQFQRPDAVAESGRAQASRAEVREFESRSSQAHDLQSLCLLPPRLIAWHSTFLG